MRARSATIAGVLSLATAVHATGSAIINNNCNHDVYLWPISVDESPASATVIKANGGSWNQPYKTCSSGGMSLKLSNTDDVSKGITQFEYTLEPGTIWYDISNVNCLPFGLGLCPFGSTGMSLKSGSGCPTAICEAGNATCHDAYTFPDDNWASLSCKPSADTTLELCSSSSGDSSSDTSSSDGIIGQVTSAVGALLGADSTSTSSTEAAPSTTTPTTTAVPTTSTEPTPTPTPTTSSSTSSESSTTKAKPSPLQWSAVGGKSDLNGVAAAAVATSSSAAPPTTEEAPTPSSSVVATTLATVAITTVAPENPNLAVVYETVTTMVSTTVVYQHKMFHKEKRGSPHPHARRHHHQE